MEKKFEVWYSESGKQLVVILLFPLIIAGLVGLSFLFVKNPTEIEIGLRIGIGIAIEISVTIYAALKWMKVPGEISFNENGFALRITNTNFLYKDHDLKSTWKNVERVLSHQDEYNISLRIRLINPSKTFLLSERLTEGKAPGFCLSFTQNYEIHK